MKRLYLLTTVLLLALSGQVAAQQSQQFGDYSIHYNAINSNLIPAQVAQGYGIQRSASRAILNITVLDTSSGEPGEPVHARVTAQAVNLTGQRRDIEMREITEPEGGLYYIGELPIHNLENYNFKVSVSVEGEKAPFELSFRQQFYTE